MNWKTALQEEEDRLFEELKSIIVDPNNVTGEQVAEYLKAIDRYDLPIESIDRVQDRLKRNSTN